MIGNSGTDRRDYFMPGAGTDVMITIFCDFCQFSAKKLAFFSIIIVMITFPAKLPFIGVKNVLFFRQFFLRN
jgi:hypothetical protein